MTSTELHVEATLNSTFGIATIWKTAVNDYERITGVQIQPLATVNDISGVISEINKDETRFKHHRHDGSKLDKFRSLVCQSLTPIEVLSNIVAQAIKTVRGQIHLHIKVNLIHARYRRFLRVRRSLSQSDILSVYDESMHFCYVVIDRELDCKCCISGL